jgi:hypothetical protein
MFEEKTVLAETDFMTCEKCSQYPCRIKMSNDGFLFATCIGFPNCKNAFHTLPKCVRNLQILKDEPPCERCLSTSNHEVYLLKITFFSSGIKQIKDLCKSVDYKFCLFNKCDETLAKIKFLSKHLKIPPKQGTFADSLTEEEL